MSIKTIDELMNRIERERNALAAGECGCWTCLNSRNNVPVRMIVCASCGNKRCPKGTNHMLECTNSNDPGQPGSRYE